MGVPYVKTYRGSVDSEGCLTDPSASGAVLEKGPKRHSCPLRAAIGCNKTFTSAGHASRHSKIHTAKSAVACTNPGCEKKFTRRDNMKQHLETHYTHLKEQRKKDREAKANRH
jgi:uncharacterized Zn-finger protein